MTDKVSGIIDGAYSYLSHYLTEQDTATRDSLRPGEQYVPSKKLQGEYRDKFDKDIAKHRAAAQDIVDGYRAKLDARLAEAPSDEALRALKAADMRKNLTEKDIRVLRKKWGDNWTMLQSINDLAERHHIFDPWQHDPIKKTDDALASLQKSVDGIHLFSMEGRTAQVAQFTANQAQDILDLYL